MQCDGAALIVTNTTPIFAERRFPVRLDTVVPDIRALYHRSKDQCWNPQRDVDWDSFTPANYSAEQLAAAALFWSRITWIESTGLAETPSLLVRFCVERDREADPKLFLTVRNTEEAWHIECGHRFAELCNGYIDSPTSAAYAASFNRRFPREALHAETSLDAYVAAHCALADGLELALWEGYRRNATDSVASHILDLCIADKQRHVEFGWLYLKTRSSTWDETTCTEIAEYVDRYVRDVELEGYRCPSLAPPGQTEDLVEAEAISAAAGLGGVNAEQERQILRAWWVEGTERLAKIGVGVAPLVDQRLPD